MNRRDARRAEDLRLLRRELDVAQALEQIAKPMDTDIAARMERRITYTQQIVGRLPLTTEALMVAISEIAFIIEDTSPPSVMTVRRWLFLHLGAPCQIRKNIHSGTSSPHKTLTVFYGE